MATLQLLFAAREQRNEPAGALRISASGSAAACTGCNIKLQQIMMYMLLHIRSFFENEQSMQSGHRSAPDELRGVRAALYAAPMLLPQPSPSPPPPRAAVARWPAMRQHGQRDAR